MGGMLWEAGPLKQVRGRRKVVLHVPTTCAIRLYVYLGMMRRLAWFSCGAASAVAAKLAVEKYGAGCEVVYCDTMATEHPDNQRFFDEVQAWLGVPIKVIRSEKYATIDDVFQKVRYMSGTKGARCTAELKKLPREAYQLPDDIHIFGYTSDEQRRADMFEDNNPALPVEWVLIDHDVSKEVCLSVLANAGIKLPVMYALGFDHNNCLGCVKSSSPGYWNRTRRLFPEVFARRARQSRLLGVKLVRIGEERVNGKRRAIRCFLDELDPALDAPDDNIDCGPVCQIPEPKEEDCDCPGPVCILPTPHEARLARSSKP